MDGLHLLKPISIDDGLEKDDIKHKVIVMQTTIRSD